MKEAFLHVNTEPASWKGFFPSSFLFLESLMLPRARPSCWTRGQPYGAREEK